MKQNKRAEKNTVVSALLKCGIGALFLINPNFNIVDIIPDAVGYVLILSGLRALEAVSPSIEEARTRFSRLLKISLIRIVSLPLTFVVGYNEKTFILIFTLAFALLETIYLVPAFHYLFDGTAHLSLRYGGDKIKALRPPRMISAFFVISRAVLNVLPELQYLPTEYSDEGLLTTVQRPKIAEFSNMLILVNIVFTLVIAIIWVLLFRKYLKRLRVDECFVPGITDELAHFAPDENGILLRSFKLIFTLLSFACFACLDFYADGYNLLPDIIPALLLLVAVALLYRSGQCGKVLLILSRVYALVSAVLFPVGYYFAQNYFRYLVIAREDAVLWNTIVILLSIVCAILFIVVVYLLCRALVSIVDRHAGMFVEVELRKKNEKTQRERIRVRNSVWISFVLAVMSESMGVIYGALNFEYAVLWIPSAAITLIFGIFMANTLNNLYYQIELRYGK